jgi:hypothetical protein
MKIRVYRVDLYVAPVIEVSVSNFDRDTGCPKKAKVLLVFPSLLPLQGEYILNYRRPLISHPILFNGVVSTGKVT